ncbi:MAG: hypothetical protein HOG49_09910, partial [Candidatus Scalindua sp.]|nr:hypothetical protein [Candidatus Scalindua sp.]
GKEYYTEDSRQRGRAVHLATEYYDKGILDESTVHERVVGYLNAYKKAKAELCLNIHPEDIEIRVFHRGLNVCGMIDKLDRTTKTLIDIKTGIPKDEDYIQTGGYIVSLEEFDYQKRLILYLNKNGNYKCDWCSKPERINDIRDFISINQIFNRGLVNERFHIG